MKSFITRNKEYLLLFLVFVICELIVNPIGDFPLNDDWTYGKSVLIYKDSGKINVGDFAAMTLFSHIMWGYAFSKVFWFSFSVLRFSTLISSFIGITFFYKLLLRITEQKNTAIIGALVLLLNPLYFNLSNTFMTDVNFNTLLILCCYFAFDFYRSQSRLSLILVFIFSLLLVLVRQFGIIVPLCFTLLSVFIKEKRWPNALLSLSLTIIVIGIFKYYESYLKSILGPDSAYKFSSDSDITSKVFWDTYWYNFKLRYAQITLNILLYTAPIASIFLIFFIKKSYWLLSVFILGIGTYVMYNFMKDEQFPIGNIFTNMSLGAETFYETLFPELKSPHEHTYSENFAEMTTVFKYLFCTITFTVLLFALVQGIRARKNSFKIPTEFVFLLALLFAYISMLLITESYFDRYHIPIFTIFILMLSFISAKEKQNYFLAGIFLIVMFYVSVFGTKDYLELNRNRWEAYHYLKETKKIDPVKINGGFEVNCWNEGKRSWWYDFFSLNNYNYLIQYRKEPHFNVYKQIKFQRYFPYKTDAIYIFSRDTIRP